MISPSNFYYKLENGDFVMLWKSSTLMLMDFIVIETTLSKRWAGLNALKRDFTNVKFALEEMEGSNHSLIVQQSLLFYSVVTYCKAFTTNESNRPRLEYKDVFKNAHIQIHEDHILLMNLRNNYVAHGNDEFDRQVVSGNIVEFGKIYFGLNVNLTSRQVNSMPLKANNFIKVCEYVLKYIEIKLEKSWFKLSEYASSLSADQVNSARIKLQNCELYEYKFVEDKSAQGYSINEFVKIKYLGEAI